MLHDLGNQAQVAQLVEQRTENPFSPAALATWKELFEAPPYRRYRCGACGHKGHNKRTCAVLPHWRLPS